MSKIQIDAGEWCGECGSPLPNHNRTCPSNVARLERELVTCQAELARERLLLTACKQAMNLDTGRTEWCHMIEAIDAALKQEAGK